MFWSTPLYSKTLAKFKSLQYKAFQTCPGDKIPQIGESVVRKNTKNRVSRWDWGKLEGF